MHSAALHLAPILAEKSRTPFFIAGGVLAAWALIVSLGLGLRHPAFPASLGGERGVIAISLLLVLGATSTAVITSSAPAKASAASAQPAATGAGTPGAPPPGTSSPGTQAASTSLSLSASATTLAYNTKTLSAKAGAVTLTFTNPAALEHNVTIAQGSAVLGATPTFTAGSKSLTLNLKPGTYTFYCSVPGHRGAGMEGTLTVS
jgi:plastocyanin